MERRALSEEQVRELVSANKCLVDSETRFMSRCIDGRYENEEGLPALAIPGADAGQLAVIIASAKDYGLEIDREKAYESLVRILGGERNLRMHTDDHSRGGEDDMMAGCGYMRQISLAPGVFNIDENDLKFIYDKFRKAKGKGAQERVLRGEHLEGAVLIVRGGWGIYPRYTFDADNLRNPTRVFIFHQTLVDERHRALAEEFIKNGTFKNLKASDSDYLFMVLTETSEKHFLEIIGIVAKGLPISKIEFDADGDFDLEHLEEVASQV